MFEYKTRPVGPLLIEFNSETGTRVWLDFWRIESIYEIAKPTDKAKTTITMQTGGGWVLSDDIAEVVKRINKAVVSHGS